MIDTPIMNHEIHCLFLSSNENQSSSLNFMLYVDHNVLGSFMKPKQYDSMSNKFTIENEAK